MTDPRFDPRFERLLDLMRYTFGQPGAIITRQSTSADIPGWDSLNHTLLMMEIDAAFGVMLEADRTATLADVGELFDLLVATLDGAGDGQGRPG